MKKIVVFLPNQNPLQFMNPAQISIDKGILTILTKDNYVYTTSLPFMVEEKED